MEELIYNGYDSLAESWKEMLTETQEDAAFYYRLRDQFQDDEDARADINGILIGLNTCMEDMHREIIRLKDQSRRIEGLPGRGPHHIELGNGPAYQRHEAPELPGGQSAPIFGYDD